MEKAVSGKDLQVLRQSGILNNDEVALIVGDLIVAENVISKSRRVLETSGLILESSKKILRD